MIVATVAVATITCAPDATAQPAPQPTTGIQQAVPDAPAAPSAPPAAAAPPTPAAPDAAPAPAAATPTASTTTRPPVPDLPRVPEAPGTVERPAVGPTAPEIPVEGGIVDFIQPTDGPEATVNIDLGGVTDRPSNSVLIIVLLTLLSVAPSVVILMSSFTRIAVVLSLTRNAIGLQAIPPNQVIAGLALFLSLFVMRPTLEAVNDNALQPFLKGEITQEVALERAQEPVRTFMLRQTDQAELSMLMKASGQPRPATPADVSLLTLIPAFILSELKKAFIIGFIIFIPFLVIDIVVSSSLMSVGMMMLPPVLVSLPFKLLLFVMVDGWGLIIKSLLESFR
jgi:flagellar biosynthetic protein FliP